MKKQTTIKSIASCALIMGAKGTFAHENHGFSGSHWHASSALGFVVAAGLMAAAIWLSRK